ncbi:MAG: hypothetical protein KatS3mg121_1398 [Gammaproteobacteria bacterium]|nr:MAG: hypothetical protein KatS3mg121_1398 [Gammaproteobacteria bacterium]
MRVRERLQDAAALLGARGIDPERCRQLWADFSDDYVLRHTSEEIAWHTQAILEADPASLPRVVISERVTRGTTPIFIYARGNDGFFAAVTSVLTRLGLNIVDARIITSKSGHTLDTYLVLDEHNRPIQDPARIAEMREQIERGIRAPRELPPPPRRPLPRQLRHFKVPTRITTERAADGRYTLMELIAGDRPGLLADVARTLYEFGLRVHDAKISTLGETAENIFLISDRDDRPVEDPAVLEPLLATLKERIESGR